MHSIYIAFISKVLKNEDFEKYNDKCEYLFINDMVTENTKSLYDKHEANLDINVIEYEADEVNFEKFRYRSKQLKYIGFVNTGDNCIDTFYVDLFSGNISVLGSGDEAHFRWNICKNVEELINIFKQYVNLYKNNILKIDDEDLIITFGHFALEYNFIKEDILDKNNIHIDMMSLEHEYLLNLVDYQYITLPNDKFIYDLYYFLEKYNEIPQYKSSLVVKCVNVKSISN